MLMEALVHTVGGDESLPAGSIMVVKLPGSPWSDIELFGDVYRVVEIDDDVPSNYGPAGSIVEELNARRDAGVAYPFLANPYSEYLDE